MPTYDPVKVISRSVLFYGTSWPALEELVTMGKFHEFDAAKDVLAEGNLVGGLHVLMEGSVEIIKNGQTQVAVLEAGNFFGEITLFGQSIVATATVRAVKRSTLLVFTRQALEIWLKNHPDAEATLFRNLATELCNRLHTTTERYVLGFPAAGEIKK